MLSRSACACSSGGIGLGALGFEFIAFKAYEERSGLDELTFFDGNLDDTAADLRADLDLAGFDGAGVGEAAAVRVPGKHDPDGDQSRDDGDGDENAAAVHASSHH